MNKTDNLLPDFRQLDSLDFLKGNFEGVQNKMADSRKSAVDLDSSLVAGNDCQVFEGIGNFGVCASEMIRRIDVAKIVKSRFGKEFEILGRNGAMINSQLKGCMVRTAGTKGCGHRKKSIGAEKKFKINWQVELKQ